MYNMYPIFDMLAKDQEKRTRLLNTCYEEIRAIDGMFPWMEVLPLNKLDSNQQDDELGYVLNDPQVPSPSQWWDTRNDWEYDAQKTVAVENSMVEIQGEYSEDMNVFFTVDDVRDLFDFSKTYYE